jgi:hypothetical protein
MAASSRYHLRALFQTRAFLGFPLQSFTPADDWYRSSRPLLSCRYLRPLRKPNDPRSIRKFAYRVLFPSASHPHQNHFLSGLAGAPLLRLCISEAFSLSTLATASGHLLFRTFLSDAKQGVTVPYSFTRLRDRLNLTNKVIQPL